MAALVARCQDKGQEIQARGGEGGWRETAAVLRRGAPSCIASQIRPPPFCVCRCPAGNVLPSLSYVLRCLLAVPLPPFLLPLQLESELARALKMIESLQAEKTKSANAMQEREEGGEGFPARTAAHAQQLRIGRHACTGQPINSGDMGRGCSSSRAMPLSQPHWTCSARVQWLTSGFTFVLCLLVCRALAAQEAAAHKLETTQKEVGPVQVAWEMP